MVENNDEYQPSGAGGTRSPPATTHCQQNPKWPPGGQKMVDGVWKIMTEIVILFCLFRPIHLVCLVNQVCIVSLIYLVCLVHPSPCLFTPSPF